MPQTQDQYASSMIATLMSSTDEVTNFNVGSVVRGLVDGASAELARLDQEDMDGTAQTALNVAYGIWGITPLPAEPSKYLLTISNANTSSQPVNAGTAITIPGSVLYWTTDSTVTVPAASGGVSGTATVTATCQTAGSATVVPANTITQFQSPISGLTVTNQSGQPVSGGTDAETPTQTQARLANQQNSLHKGDPYAVAWSALQATVTDASGNVTERVTKALADDLSAGKMVVYYYGSNGAPSANLTTQVQNAVNGYTDAQGVVHIGSKAAGIVPTFLAANAQAVAVTCAVLPQTGYSLSMVQSAVQSAIQAYFSSLDIEQALSLAGLIRAILQVPGVADVSVSTPAANLASVPTVANPSTAPSLTAVAGATGLAAGTYTVGYTWTNLWGETQISPTQTVTITAGQAIQVGAVTLPFGATGVNYYLSVSAGSGTVAYDANGNGAQTNLTALPAAGAASSPASNTCSVRGNLYTAGTITITQMAAS